MAQRFQVGWMRLIPFLGYHHVLMILIAIAIILLSLLLAGCSSSSPLIPGIFLISLYYQKYSPVPSTAQVDFNAHNAIAVVAGDAMLQCRVGYFGICINPDGGSWLCSNNATALADQISLTADPLNLIWLASQFKDMIVFPYLIIIAIIFAFICLLLLATFPGWHEEEDRDGSDEKSSHSLEASLPNRPRHHLHLFNLHPRFRPMATHGIRSRLNHCPRFWERKRTKWCRNHRDGARMVQFCVTDHCHYRPTSYDFKHKGSKRDIWIEKRLQGSNYLLIGQFYQPKDRLEVQFDTF